MVRLERSLPIHADVGCLLVGQFGQLDAQLIEVQRGDYLGEDDIVRLQDDFGRTA